jgi:tryptophan synthase alpha chain
MTRLEKLFENKKKRVLNIYGTAGYPELNSTRLMLRALEQNGVDIIELGMPYSDPLADGPVIQASSATALANGMTLEVLFEQLTGMRDEIAVPVVLMGYLNPLLQYGFEEFCAKAAEVGVDGLIIPDIPVMEYEREYRAIVERHGLHFIFLVTPETPESRIRLLDEASSGFLYAVSSSSVTGSSKDFSPVQSYLERLQKLGLKNPVLIGFGIRDKASFASACAHAQGAIIGSAYIEAISKGTSIEEATQSFLAGLIQ